MGIQVKIWNLMNFVAKGYWYPKMLGVWSSYSHSHQSCGQQKLVHNLLEPARHMEGFLVQEKCIQQQSGVVKKYTPKFDSLPLKHQHKPTAEWPKPPGDLVSIGEHTTYLYTDYFTSHEPRIPMNQAGFHEMSGFWTLNCFRIAKRVASTIVSLVVLFGAAFHPQATALINAGCPGGRWFHWKNLLDEDIKSQLFKLPCWIYWV